MIKKYLMASKMSNIKIGEERRHTSNYQNLFNSIEKLTEEIKNNELIYDVFSFYELEFLKEEKGISFFKVNREIDVKKLLSIT